MSESFFVTTSYDQSMRVWQMGWAKQIAAIPHPEAQVNALALTETGNQLGTGAFGRLKNECRWLYTGGEDNSCRVYDMRGSSQLVCQRVFEATAPVQSVCLHPNQVELFISDVNGCLYCWDLRADAHESIPSDLVQNEFMTRVCVHPQGTLLAACTNRGHLMRWNLLAGEGESSELCPEDGTRFALPKPFQAHDGYALSCRYSTNGEYLVTSSSEDSVKIFNGTTNQEVKEIKGGGRWVWDAAITNDCEKIVLGNDESKAHLIDFASGKILQTYEGHSKPITGLVAHDGI